MTTSQPTIGTIIRRVTNGHPWYTLDGYMMPSPSKIKLSQPFLDNYHAGCAADVLDDDWGHLASQTASARRKYFLERTTVNMGKAAEDGKLRHKLMEQMLTGVKATSQDDAAVADATAATRLFDRWKITPVASEQAVVCTEANVWCSGTTDLIADVPGYGTVILDFKFGKEVWPDHALQLSAYTHMTHAIVEIEHAGPRGGKLPSTWELGELAPIRRDIALIVHTTGGVAQLHEVRTDGWVWDTVRAWCAAWWLWDHRTRSSSPRYDPPVSEPLTPPADDPAPF